MSDPTGRQPEAESPGPWRLWDHIGRISGTLLGLVAVGFLLVVALGGGAGGTGLIVVLVAGIALVYFGGRLHGLKGRS